MLQSYCVPNEYGLRKAWEGVTVRKGIWAWAAALLLIMGAALAEEAEEGKEIPFTLFPAIYYTAENQSVYDPEYSTTLPVRVGKYNEVTFDVYWQEPACALAYDDQMHLIEAITGAEYGQRLRYALPDGAAFLRIPMERERSGQFHIRGRVVEVSPEPTPEPTPGPRMTVETEKREGDEYPLQTIIQDGGMTKIFRTMGVVGDSLSSGAMTYVTADGEAKQKNVNMYEYSWIQYMARYCGSTAYNFSVSGMGTDTFFGSQYYDMMMDGDHLCQAYFIALGHNDYNRSVPIGSLEDVDLENWEHNGATFTGNYARIISEIQSIQPTAKIFPILMKKERRYSEYNDAIRAVSALFQNVYLLEMDIYAVERQDWEDTLGHGNTMGYLNYSYQISSYVDWIIRHKPEEFKYVQFIGTKYEKELGLR